MAAGSSLPAVKTRLEAVLEARNGLDGVPVTDGGPVRAEDLQNDDGGFEAIWFGDAITVSIDTPVSGTPVYLDEVYDLEVVIQVLKAGDEADTQAVATARSTALLGEVIGALAADPSLGYTPTATIPWIEALPDRWEHHGGWLGSAEQHGSRYELKVRVTARLQLS